MSAEVETAQHDEEKRAVTSRAKRAKLLVGVSSAEGFVKRARLFTSMSRQSAIMLAAIAERVNTQVATHAAATLEGKARRIDDQHIAQGIVTDAELSSLFPGGVYVEGKTKKKRKKTEKKAE